MVSLKEAVMHLCHACHTESIQHATNSLQCFRLINVFATYVHFESKNDLEIK